MYVEDVDFVKIADKRVKGFLLITITFTVGFNSTKENHIE
jgi:hypothetical protein